MAALAKLRPDGSTKLRLIIDMLRSGVNAHARVHERIVLPRVSDLLADTLDLLRAARAKPDESLEFLVLDWEDAFHSIGVWDTEKPHQVVKGIGSTFVGYETVLFGGAGSPSVWGRAAAFLGRSGQALFDHDEARVQVYVDDPCTVWRGTSAQR